MRIARSPMLIAAALLALGGCGLRNDLKPKVGAQLPVAPYGSPDRPGSAELLASTPQARPGRNVELHERSEPRADDPFDLPPRD